MQAVILCGGLGTRLKSVVSDVPKPMAPVGDLPFLHYIVEHLKSNGFDKFLFLTGYKSEVIEEYFSEYDYSVEQSPLGTGGALFNAFEKLEDDFFLINGDTFFDIDFEIFNDYIKDNSVNAAIALFPTKNIERYGLVEIEDDFSVKNFVEKSNLDNSLADGFINSGIYYFKKPVLEKFYSGWNNNFVSIEKEIFPELVKTKELKGLPMGGLFIDIGIPEDYEKAQTLIPQRIKETKRPALFIDRDGTMIEDKGYTFGEDLNFFSDTVDLVREYKNKGYLVLVVTNQAGVAKGKFTEQDTITTNNAIKNHYLKQNIEIDDFVYCPFHINGIIEKYSKASVYRKPNSGMVLELGSKYKIDYKKSLFYGDNVKIDKINLPYLVFEQKESNEKIY